MEHLQVKAAATATDKGQFSALAATYSVDRVQERIIPGAFEKTIGAWQQSGKNVPLHWDHQGEAENVIGYIDPATMEEREEGLYVEGQLDLKTSGVAREAWRSMKNNAVSLSFGYLPKTRKGKNGVTEITEIDLFEVSIVPAPANADTRVLSLKSALEDISAESVEPQEANIEGQAWNLIVNNLVAKNPKKKEPEPTDEASEGYKATWTSAYITALPDSAFLHIENGEKHFPYRDANGIVDLPHLRHALAGIPKANLSRKVRDELTEKAQRILDNATKALSAVEDGDDEEPEKAKSVPQDPLVQEAWSLVLPKTSPRRAEPEPEPEPEPLDAAEVQREAWGLVLKSSG